MTGKSAVTAEGSLIGSGGDSPVRVDNRSGRGPFVLVCEHASNKIPAALDSLGLGAEALQSHAAWDPGASGVARHMSALLDAPLVRATYSRLVYDCNRPLGSPDATRETSEVYGIPGNVGLSAAEQDLRRREIYLPFRDELASVVAERVGRGKSFALATIHTFNPVYFGERRDTELGIVHAEDSRLADAMLRRAGETIPLLARRNDPYGPGDGVDHTIREHALPAGLHNVMIEIRNDLVATREDQRKIAALLASLLRVAWEETAGSFVPEAVASA